MATAPDIELDLHSVQDRALGREGLSAARLATLAPRIARTVTRIERELQDGQHRHRALPRDRLMRQAIAEFAAARRPQTRNLVVLGIGGSALGTTALHQALCHPHYNLLPHRRRGGPRLFVMDNVDPDLLAGMLDVVEPELSRTTFNVITKSGETVETVAQFLLIRDLLEQRLGADRARNQLLVTTDSHSGSMRSIVNEWGYASLPVPEGVGGRFSVLSAVGLFPAAMCGIDIAAVLRGAAHMERRIRSTSLQHNPAARYAAVNYLYYRRGRHIAVMMPYSNRLSGLTQWFRQLWAESLGKASTADGRRRVHIGPTPVSALGATDQHSQMQLYREGPQDKLITFLEVDHFAGRLKIPKRAAAADPPTAYLGGVALQELLNTAKQATERALLDGGRPSVTVRFPRISAHTVGQFIMLMEAATTVTALLFGVNPYDQPGVELGKRITYHLLGRPGFERLPRSDT